MADTARQQNLNLTPEEKRAFYQLFQAADTTNLGVITGEVAVPFFEKTKLAPETLGLIWQIADKENRGLLTPSGFGIVLRLIGHAQAGQAPTEELALQPGPLPRFDGVVIDVPPAPREAGTTSPPPAAGAPIRVPPLNPDDVNKFVSLFDKSDVAGTGVLSGEIAKQIFERARLPNDILGRIWNLADTKQRGALDATEFIIAMHFLTSYKSGAMRGIPQVLPPGLYEAAARRGSARGSVGSRPGLDVPPVPAIPKQFTGPQRTQSPINRQQFGSPLSAQSTGGEWLITPAEKNQFDSIFATIDTAKLGSISGDQAVGFFMNAQLPEETLAQIWDLADIDADGQLTKDEFAVAMYLVRLQRSGKEPIPQVLPPALIPPSMRRRGSGFVAPAVGPAQPPAPASVPAPPPPPRTAADDLFGLDSAPAPAVPAAPSQVAQSTGGSNSVFQTPASPSRASPPGPSPAATSFKPFIPSSSFGQSLQPQVTGGAPPAVRSPPPPADDLLGDNDPEESKKLTSETTELANLSNQIGSLANEMQNVQTKRTAAEQDLTQSSQQKRDFETRLAQARAMYEQEVKQYKALEERLTASRTETKKLEQEFALLDGSRQDLQNQYDQISAALSADTQENASLKERIRQANAVVAQLKPALDKARSEARRQKGLVAINKKQLATVEGERDKLQEEIADASPESASEPVPEEDRAATPAAPTASPPPVTSPAESTTSQNTNPFFRRTVTGSSDGNQPSPQVSNDQQRAFDSLFGPSFGAPSAGAPPPPTSFGAQSPSTSRVPTPSMSPPPPPESRQLTPGVLPITEIHTPTSSTMASPPASRSGGPDTASQGAPSEAAGPTSAASPFDEAEDPKERFPEVPGLPQDAAARAVSPTTAEGKQPEKKDPTFDELFGGPAHQRTQSQKENDFDEAFASMKQGSQPNGAQAAAPFEFPPIRELDDDEETTDSEAPRGFDDNFTPAQQPSGPAPTSKPADSIEPSQLAAFPTPGSMPTSPQFPPSPGAQQSPPNYTQSVGTPEPGQAPAAFNGLLPGRGDPTAPPDAPHSVDHATGEPVVGGEAPKEAPAAEPSTGKAGGPDFEAAFAGLNLAPAKEDDDDDTDTDTPDQKNNEDFDFSFDNPAQQQAAAAAGAQGGNAAAPDSFTFDKNASSTSPSATTPAPPPGGSQTQNHDWEALFAPLDNVAPNGSSAVDRSKEPGWAQSNTEDDLILQKLTGMGFPRDDSLAALEKFDYNIDKAADYLTSKV
ncbi:EF hand domain protein [Aspergillus candidus]|uniref:Actin cytoskeleton-regulatory complex protein END3 n=1 Tax=Aspergillus candidus TaxID=41067 RepID=A0A2I2FLJ9_ASPCN|nr:hypothetical protein BDW47DRAFT_115255 [Aspergillus candidus]PLB41517.1 hypothetical protein BDW47DRAFT_115255 [Aspergillus candidus]